LVLMSVWFVFLSKRIKIKDSPLSALACGGLSGLLGGLFSMSGPPAVVSFLESSKGDNLRYLGTIQAYFLITNAFSCVVKASNGFLTREVAVLYAAGLLGVLAGAAVGSLVFNRLDGGKLRKTVYVFMACSGVVNVVTGIIRLTNQGG
ncbi:MAG: TSUP family transporter, partial [Clostridia bacterium]|nr:TSUP family transporter [Clostridia bacterium]